MNEIGFAHHEHSRRRFANLLIFCSILGAGAIVTPASGESPKLPLPSRGRIENAFIVTQLPAGTALEQQEPAADGMLRANFGDGARLVKIYPDFSTEVLSRSFHSACG